MPTRPLRAAEILTLYLLTAAVFLTFDVIWMEAVAKGFYTGRLEGLLRAEINWAAAAGFYLVYIAGVLAFVLLPALRQGGIARAAAAGAAFGLVAYAAFDLTALALIRGWPLAVAVVDMLWGTTLTGATAAIVTWMARKVV